MHTRYPFLLICLLILLLGTQAACKREKKTLYGETISVGDYASMLLQKLDYTQYPGYPNGNRFEIDVNKDGIQDLAIVCFDAGSPGAGSLPGSTLLTLHSDMSVYALERPDSNFQSLTRDTTTLGDTVFCYTRFYSGCKKKNSYDTLTSVNALIVPENLSSGFILTRTDNWHTLNYTLGASPYSNPTVNFISPDTFKIELRDYDNTCNRPVLSQEIIYGLRFKEGDQYRLGWIKLRMEGKGTVYLQEVALQSNY